MSEVIVWDDDVYNNTETEHFSVEHDVEHDIEHEIVVYNNKLYILLPVSDYEECQAYWGIDYYAYRTHMSIDNDIESVIYSNEFMLKRDSKELTIKGGSSIITTESKKKNYQHYMANVQHVDDKSNDNLDRIHYELIRKRVMRKLLNVPTKDEILKRELEHRNKIRVEIDKVLKELPTLLYKCADDGIIELDVKFKNICEKHITAYGGLPRFEKYPCDDGKVRERFDDYVYYLFEELYHKHIDEGDDPHLWVGARVMEQLKKIYPHLSMNCEACSGEMFVPRIRIRFDVDLSVAGVLH